MWSWSILNYCLYICRYIHFFSVAPQSLKDLGRLTYRRFLELFRHMVGLLGRVISRLQGLYQHRTTQHRKTRTNIHALSGIRTHDPSNQPAKTHASDRTATVTGRFLILRKITIITEGYSVSWWEFRSKISRIRSKSVACSFATAGFTVELIG
jgi:hypothetical protein